MKNKYYKSSSGTGKQQKCSSDRPINNTCLFLLLTKVWKEEKVWKEQEKGITVKIPMKRNMTTCWNLNLLSVPGINILRSIIIMQN